MICNLQNKKMQSYLFHLFNNLNFKITKKTSLVLKINMKVDLTKILFIFLIKILNRLKRY